MKFSLTALALAGPVLALDTALLAQAPARTGMTSTMVVSATKVEEDALDVPAPVSVVSGEELRRHGAKTIAEALQDVAGLDTGNGSDNGGRLANIGVWGLKEFDALLVTVDGVPAGGPFNPSLAQISVEDVERIEIVKGPQGTLYGVSAFAGMVQVFTRRPKEAGGALTLGGGSFSDKYGNLSYTASQGDRTIRLFGSMARNRGWQDGTDVSVDRLSLGYTRRTKEGSVDVTLGIVRDTSHFGSPLPVDGGQPVPGFEVDRNYAVGGGRLDHRVYSLASTVSQPLSGSVRFENTLGATRDEQIAVRSYIVGSDGTTAAATGTSLTPLETTLFDDARIVANFTVAGHQRLVAGIAYTAGRTTLDGAGFDFSLLTGPHPLVPTLDEVPVGDHRSAKDRRTFWGFYANDEWTPFRALTLTFGARYDRTSESLDAARAEVGAPAPDVTSDSRTGGAWSGGVAALVRLVDRPKASFLNALNVYVSAKSNFKPAAPNVLEAESARILEPERTRSGEIGLKSRWAGGTLSFDVTLFHMKFENLVVSTAGPLGQPLLTNAGEERFQGLDAELVWALPKLEGWSLAAGYGHHDATYVSFSFLTPDGELRVVDGKRLELVPRDLWNARLAYAPKTGLGFWGAVRHQGIRPLTRRNTFYTDSFYEWDAGASWEFSWGRVSLVGRNLGDDRHYVSDSEIGDGQFYVAPPRRFLGEIAFRF
ncbi:MAG TPA: TonB-dependent receptor [Thermoanaerobaculia bacterium]|nr:TonB-dependent receptor [Thermoanaerobaculia bacterium]